MADSTDSDTSDGCSICLQGFTQPEVLECGHCFCFKCLDDYVQRYKKDERVSCPLCRTSVRMLERGVAEFSDQGRTHEFYEEVKLVICELCEDDVNAEFRCDNCEQNLCISCKRIHSMLKACRSHTVVQIEYVKGRHVHASKQKDYCPNHPTSEAGLYCKECLAAVCSKCFVTSHNGHNYLDLENEVVIHKTKEDLKSLIHNLEASITKFEEYTGNLSTRLSEIYEKAETECMTIDNRIENMCGQIRKVGCELKQRIKTTRDEEKFKFEKLILTMKHMKNDQISCVKNSNIMLEDSSTIQVLDWIIEASREKAESDSQNLDIPDLRYSKFTEGQIDIKSLEEQIGTCEIHSKDISIKAIFPIKPLSRSSIGNTVFQHDEGAWRLYGCYIGNDPDLNIYLSLHNSERGTYRVQFTCTLINHKNYKNCKIQKGTCSLLAGGLGNVLMSIKRDELLNPQTGYLDDNSNCHLEVCLNINKAPNGIPGLSVNIENQCFIFGNKTSFGN